MVLLFFLFFHFPVIQIQTDQHTYFLNDDSFTLSWTHSVEKEKWYEKYKNQNGELILTETYFKTFGAGVPAEGKDTEVEDGFVRMEINRQMDELNVVVSENVQTTIETSSKDIPLYQMVEPYSEVNITTRNIHLWNIFGGEFL
ncbi:hypothetical protein TMU01_24650 [Tenuibacillus multivorans]|uniref:DUF1850 domain-containing protein n=1 Tax=Tenuibacillus multivorans TaxID=237069 RepID=A0A1H0APX2_9BACI|nr:hypothetical protein TMU01_24650 [Tenuibacillus multivorans]SDN35431.1 protein of unknown function [Tenuibacillus multivorans]